MKSGETDRGREEKKNKDGCVARERRVPPERSQTLDLSTDTSRELRGRWVGPGAGTF